MAFTIFSKANPGWVFWPLMVTVARSAENVSFSMLPDPKTSPKSVRGRVLWGAGIALVDGVLRYLEIRYSMFFALFAFCAVLPLFHRMRAGPDEAEHWKVIERPLR